MAFRRFTVAEMLNLTGPWVAPGHAERLALELIIGPFGLVKLVDSAHGDLLATLDFAEVERLGLLRDDLGLKDLRHDDLARIISLSMRAHEYLHRGKPEARAIADTRAIMFPDDLQIVRAGYRESAGRAEMRISQLTDERKTILASIPVQGGTLLDLMHEWNQVALEMGALQDQRAVPAQSAGERVSVRAVRDRWVRAVKAVLATLELEASARPEARRILDRVASIRAEVRRRLRASSNTAPDDDGADLDGGDGDDLDADPANDADVPAAPAIASR
jgi:hypothetical protein